MARMHKDLNEAAKKAAGNWQDFDSFCWFGRPKENDRDWAIFYTSNRDSSLLEESNESVINEALKPFEENGDVVFEQHSHWAVGFVSGFSLKVFDADGNVTEAFKKYHELHVRMDNYPVLDESDWSERQYEATRENVASVIKDVTGKQPSNKLVTKVDCWLSMNDPDSLDDSDGRGGYPSEEAVKTALKEARKRKVKKNGRK